MSMVSINNKSYSIFLKIMINTMATLSACPKWACMIL